MAVLVVLVVVVSFWAFRSIGEAAGSRQHVSEVIHLGNDLLSDLKDAETGQRGYLLTGDGAYLEPYLTARDHLGSQLGELRRITKIPAAQRRLDAIAPLVGAKIEELAQTIELRRHHATAAMLAVVNSNRGKQLMDSIRTEMHGFIQIEDAALAEREAAFQANMRHLLDVIVAVSILTLLFAASFGYLIYRESRQRLANLIHIETKHRLEIQDEATQRLQQANAALQVSKEWLAVTLHSIGDGVIATNAEGRITLLNRVAEQLTGWTQAKAIDRPADEIFHIINQETRLPSVIPISETLARGTIQGLANHTVLIALDGSECAIADSCAPIRARDGQVIGAVLVFRDITNEDAAQKAVQEAKVELERAKTAAEKANLAKSEFLSSMSHELRSPLNAILGFAQLMESASPLPTPSAAAHIARILQAGWHLLKLINEILDLAVIESGKVSLSREAVSLPDVMSECQAMMEPQAQKHGIHLTFPSFEHPVFVTADLTRLKQIVINLVSNAIKYNRAGGTVVVDCNSSAPGRVRFSVKDEGAGLPPEKLAQLFQPFNRLGQQDGAIAGTGIGLVVTRRLAELMGGVIGVESTVGVGSVFWCELNAAAAPSLKVQTGEAEVSIRPQSPTGAPPRTLLYVEDNQANMELVEQLVARCPDIRMMTAVNGTIGIGLARATLPTVILMDINLPGISGIEALKILREDPATAHIPIIALTANAMPRDIAKGLEAGFFRYMTKPIRVNEFMNTLNAALEVAESGVVRSA